MEKDLAAYLAALRARAAENADAARAQRDVEGRPTYFQKQQEREGKSPFSGGSMGGGTWAGRSR
jgi:hypothetical protein